ncbi:MAG: type IX secretion system PorP/SprF family membrane protein [Bacteroidia bacterium]|jgi:type IX secretion system PorP/SprF family membrane protein
MIRAITILALLTTYIGSYAQVGYQANQYMFNQQLINPAYVGKDLKVKGGALGNNQLAGIDGSPKLLALYMSSPIGLTKASVGINFTSYAFGVQSNNEITGIYSYRIPFKKFSAIFGMQAALANNTINNGRLRGGQPGDEMYTANASGWGYNFGFGAYFSGSKSFLSISAPAWCRQAIMVGGDLETEVDPGAMPLFVSAGYEYRASNNWWIDPYFLLRYYPDGQNVLDLNVIFDYKNTVWFGPSFKAGSQFGIIVGSKVNSFLQVSYSGSISQQTRPGFSGSSHELCIGFVVKDKAVKTANSLRFF